VRSTRSAPSPGGEACSEPVRDCIAHVSSRSYCKLTWMMRFSLLAGLVCLSCAANRSAFVPGQSVVPEMIGSSILAGTASGMSRANGGCWAACPTGTTCNPHSGLCEELPCRGLCSSNEHCEITPASSHCMPGTAAPIEITIGRKGEEEPPTRPDTSAPASSSQVPAKQP
jgi:hypothetical protein